MILRGPYGVAHRTMRGRKRIGVASADARPTDQSRELFNELAEKADVEIARLQVILETDIPGLNELLRDSRIPHIIMEKSVSD